MAADSEIAEGGESIQLWDVATGQVVRTLQGHTGNITTMTISPNGQLLASGADDRTIKLWEVTTGKLVQTISDSSINHELAFAADGRLLASGIWQVVQLWDVSTGQKVRSLPGHLWVVYDVAFSPDGKLLASGSCGQINGKVNCNVGELKLWYVGDVKVE